MTADDSWIMKFRGLARLEDKVRQPLVDDSRILKLKAGTLIFGPDHSPENYLFLIDGTVRVQQVSGSGREIVLYRVVAGESCAMTTACLLTHSDYMAEGVAETDVTAAAVPKTVFDDLVARSPVFRQFVFTAFSQRMTDLFRIIDEVAFSRIDIRLAQKLLQLGAGKTNLSVTHQQLASELGTAREVVSRQLNEFQRRDWIAAARGTIDLVQPDALQKLADMR